MTPTPSKRRVFPKWLGTLILNVQLLFSHLYSNLTDSDNLKILR